MVIFHSYVSLPEGTHDTHVPECISQLSTPDWIAALFLVALDSGWTFISVIFTRTESGNYKLLTGFSNQNQLKSWDSSNFVTNPKSSPFFHAFFSGYLLYIYSSFFICFHLFSGIYHPHGSCGFFCGGSKKAMGIARTSRFRIAFAAWLRRHLLQQRGDMSATG